MKASLFLCLFLFTLAAQAKLGIPTRLNSAERKKVVEILGLSSSAKILGNPYPLGGYSGIEFGYTTEVISTGDLSTLGMKTTESQKETSYSTLTIGKGLYNNVDVFVQFTPFTQDESISSYGGQLRWGFYQAEYLPAHLSLVISGNSTNFQNKITTVTQGTDLVAGFSVQDMTLYTGLGLIRSIGTFTGGNQSNPTDPNSITDDNSSATEDVSQSHYLAGVNIRISKMFLAMQLDRSSQSTYSAKLGMRF